METFNSIVDSVFSFGADIFSTFIISGFIGSMVALFISVYAIRRMSRARMFDRPFKLWTWVVCINKVYLPMVMMVLVGMLSGIYGVNSSVNEFVEMKIQSTLQHTDLAQLDVEKLALHMEGQQTMEEMIVGELHKNGNEDHHTNTIIAKALMSELGYPTEIDEFAKKMRGADWRQLNKGISFGVSYIATDYIDGIFWMAYRLVFMFILVACIKLPALELILFFLYKKVIENTDSSNQKNLDSILLS